MQVNDNKKYLREINEAVNNLADDDATKSQLRNVINKIKSSAGKLDDNQGGQQEINKRVIPKELFLSFDELDKGNKMEAIKKNDYTLYAVIYYDQFGKYPNGMMQDKFDAQIAIVYKHALLQYKRDKLCKMSWLDLLREDLTDSYKKVDREGYKQKFTEYYGVAPVM